MPELRSRKLTLALGLCLCAGQLVATPAQAATSALPTVVTPVSASALAAVKPRVSISANRKTVNPGSPVTFTARITDPRTGAAVSAGTVQLQFWRNGKWLAWQNRHVAGGQATFTIRPRSTYGYRAVFRGAGGYSAAISGAAVVKMANGNARVIAVAKSLSGSPYRYGAAGPRAFDCSGFTQYVYRKALGKKLPHNAAAQGGHGRAVSKANAQPGDLIVMSGGGHAAIYAGGGYMYDAPTTGKRVSKRKIYTSSYVVRRLG